MRIDSVDRLGSGAGVAATLSHPQPGTASDLFAIEFRGSVAAERPVSAVQLVCYDEVIAETPVDLERSSSGNGFLTQIGAFRLPPRFTIEVRASVDGAESVALARVSGSRASLGPNAEEDVLAPALVSTPTGRTGTTWLVHLLGMHPSLVAYSPFAVEPRLASYWAEAMGSLAEPASYLQSLRPRMDVPHWFLGPSPAAARARFPRGDQGVARSVGRDGVERLAAIARERVESFYRFVAEQQSKRPRGFVEKGPFGRVRLEVVEDLLGSLGELIVFRDPRDTLCSIIAYQAKIPGTTLVTDSIEASRQSMIEIATGIAGLLEQAGQRGDRTLVVRYEDLIQSPVPTLRRAFAHLDVASDRETAESALRLAGEGDPGSVHRTSADVASSIGRWRRDLAPELRAMASETFKDVLDELGYDPPGASGSGSRSGTPARTRSPGPGGSSGADGPDPAKIVWIFASPRSGTTWLAQMLGDLPGFTMWNEPLVGKLFGRFYREERGEARGPAFILSPKFREVWLGSIRKMVLTGAADRFPRLRRRDHLVIKEPHGAEGAPLLAGAFPESRIVVLVRDPRDVIASALDAQRHEGWTSKTQGRRAAKGGTSPTRADTDADAYLRERVANYVRALESARQAYDSHPGPKAVVTYERLRSATLDTLRDLRGQLLLPVADHDLTRVVEAHDWERIPAAEKGSGKFHRKATPGGWREDLSPEQVREVERIAAPILAEYYADNPGAAAR